MTKPDSQIKVAVIQMDSGQDKGRNVRRALDLVREAVARRPDFVLLPEMFPYRGTPDPRRGYRDAAEDIPGESILPFIEEARKNKIHVLAGSICEKVRGSRKVANTSVLIDPRGHIAARYQKIHLFSAKIGTRSAEESRFFRPGKKGVLARVGAWRAGLSICYDLRFPELYRAYALQGAEILCVPSAFTKMTGQAHWEVLLKARAIENFCYVLAPNQAGRDGKGIESYGNSMILDPWGQIVARAPGSGEKILFARLSRRLIYERKRMFGSTNKMNV